MLKELFKDYTNISSDEFYNKIVNDEVGRYVELINPSTDQPINKDKARSILNLLKKIIRDCKTVSEVKTLIETVKNNDPHVTSQCWFFFGSEYVFLKNQRYIDNSLSDISKVIINFQNINKLASFELIEHRGQYINVKNRLSEMQKKYVHYLIARQFGSLHFDTKVSGELFDYKNDYQVNKNMVINTHFSTSKISFTKDGAINDQLDIFFRTPVSDSQGVRPKKKYVIEKALMLDKGKNMQPIKNDLTIFMAKLKKLDSLLKQYDSLYQKAMHIHSGR